MEWFVLILAGFAGGFVNALAGGGSFILLPAMTMVGLPPVAANASSTAALLPGYIASAWRFRHDMTLPSTLSYPTLLTVCLLGGGIGALLLLNTSNAVFGALIPWLILFATALFITGPTLTKRLTQGKSLSMGMSIGILFLVCMYGGYFNGGLGIILLASLALLGGQNLHGMNGVKNLISALLTCIAVSIYGIGGELHVWPIILASLAAIAGGYVGAVFSYAISPKWLRGLIIIIGLIMAALFFMQ